MFSPCGPLLVQVEKNYTLQRKPYRGPGPLSKGNRASPERSGDVALLAGGGRHDRCVESPSLPVVDLESSDASDAVARRLPDECGSSTSSATGRSMTLTSTLGSELSRAFFARSIEEKLAIRMELGGRAWRGYFRRRRRAHVGKPDQKEGIYFGAELPAGAPRRSLAGTPLHGANLFPERQFPDFARRCSTTSTR